MAKNQTGEAKTGLNKMGEERKDAIRFSLRLWWGCVAVALCAHCQWPTL